MLNNSNPGEAVYEPFLGSGTTLIAAETTGRICFGIELDPIYVDVAIRRWQAFTGRAATLQSDGRTFAEVEGERGAGETSDEIGSAQTMGGQSARGDTARSTAGS